MGAGKRTMGISTVLETKEQTALQCIVCGHIALQIRPFEMLPNNAVAVEAIHENNVRHTWTEYKSMEDLGKRTKPAPIRVTCPKCEKIGRVGSYRHNKTQPELVSYYVIHGSVKDRHYITDPKQRESLLKTLGRYIGPQHTPKQKLEPKPEWSCSN